MSTHKTHSPQARPPSTSTTDRPRMSDEGDLGGANGHRNGAGPRGCRDGGGRKAKATVSPAGGIAETPVTSGDLSAELPTTAFAADATDIDGGIKEPDGMTSVPLSGDTQHLDTFLIGDNDEIIVEDPHVKRGGDSTIPEAAFNFINSIVGAGIIGMPFALREAGFGLGVILIIAMGIITSYSIKTLIRCGVKTHKPNYQDMVMHCYGKLGFNLLSFGQFFFPFFGMIAYSIIIGQTLPKVFEAVFGHGFLSDRNTVITIMTLFLMIPLSMNKHIESLSRWSAVALTGVFVLILIVCIEGSLVDPPEDRGDPVAFFHPRFVQAIGVMAFAYVCHHNSFLIYDSLQNTSERRFSIVNYSSVTIAAVLSIMLGAGGSFAFGNATKDNVLDNFAIDNAAANVARFFFALAIMLTYPIECFVAREVIENYFFPNSQPPTDLRHYSVTLAVCLCVFIIALSIEDLGIILELNGIINANLIAFVIPGACGAKLLVGETFYKGERIWATLLFAFGVALFVFGVILVAIDSSSTPTS